MRNRLLCATAGVVFSIVTSAAGDQGGTGRVGTPPPPPPSPPAGGDCVTIATPQPSRVYHYQHRESTGGLTSTTNQWESVTRTESRVKTSGPQGVEIVINTYTVMGDVAILTLTRKADARGGLISSTAFSPGLVSDPAFRACKGKSWGIGAVAASYRSSSGQSHSAMTPGGTLTILGIREKITTPAGTFDTVHYLRSTSQSNDEYWKSIEHGVVVKHIGTLRGGAGTVTETLLSIK